MKKILFLLSLLIWAPLTSFADGIEEFDYSRKDFQETVGMLSMEGHGVHDVGTCSLKKLYYEEVAEMMNQGMSKDEILQYYLDIFGDEALQAPEKKGFNLTLWALPFFSISAAGSIIYFALRKWTKSRTLDETGLESFELEDTEKEIFSSIIDSERKKYL